MKKLKSIWTMLGAETQCSVKCFTAYLAVGAFALGVILFLEWLPR